MLDLGIICVDMKPENILVDWDKTTLDLKELVLTDFGMSWCCNTKHLIICKDCLKCIKNFLNIGANRLYTKYLILLSIAVMATFNTNIPLFFPEMKELLVILKDPLFHTFIDEVCGINNTDCTEFNPPFFYLEKINIIR